MKLSERFRVISRATGEIEYDGVHYTILGRGEQTGIENFEVSFRSRQNAMAHLWCFFEGRLIGPRRFFCKIEVGGVQAKTISDTTELSGPAKLAVESAFKALGQYLEQLKEADVRRAKREEELNRLALNKF